MSSPQKKQVGSSNFLCNLGLHKWKSYGDVIQVSSKEPGFVPGFRARGTWEPESINKAVYSKRQCMRCGVRSKRKLLYDSDGTVSAYGWELVTDEIQPTSEEPITMPISHSSELRLWAYLLLVIGVVASVAYFSIASSWRIIGNLWFWIVAVLVFSLVYLVVKLLTRS
jgi:hypothetical protein